MARIAIIALLLLATAPALAEPAQPDASPPPAAAPPADAGAPPPPAAAAPAEQNAAAPPAAYSCAIGRGSARIRVPDDRGVGAGEQPAARILRAGDLAGEPVPARRGRPAHAQRRARPGHRPVHAAHRGRARPARSVRSGAGAAEIGRVPARARRPVRQSRAGGGGLQCRPAAGARLAFGPAHAAGGDAQLRAGHHRALGRRVGEERQARAGAAGAAELHAADGAAAPRAQSVRAEARGAGEPGRRQPVGRAAQPPGSRATMRWRTTPCWPSAMPRC